MSNFFVVSDFDDVNPIRKRNALESVVEYAKDKKLACTDSNNQKTDCVAVMQGATNTIFHAVFPLLALNHQIAQFKPIHDLAKRQIVLDMKADGTFKVSSPVKAIPYVKEWLKTLCEDYSKMVDGDTTVVFDLGQRMIIPYLHLPPRKVDDDGTVLLEDDERPTIWTLEEETAVKEILSYIFESYPHYPFVRMKLVTTIANMFMVDITEDKMKELARDVGKVTDDLRLCKALSTREKTERKAGVEGVAAKAEMFDIGESVVDESEWDFPGTGGSSSSSNVKSEPAEAKKKTAFKEMVPRSR